MFSAFPFPAILLNEYLEVIEASPSAYELFHSAQTTGDEAQRARQLSEALQNSPDLIQAIGAASFQLNRPGNFEHFRWSTADRHFEITIYQTGNETEDLCFGALFNERTAQVLAQQGSARTRSYLEGIMNSLYLGVIVTDLDMRVTQMNEAQTSFFTRHDESFVALDAIGVTLPELLPDEAALMEEITSPVLDNGDTLAGIVKTVGTSDPPISYSIGFSPIRDEKGVINGLIRICEDISEKQRIEDELRISEVKAREAEVIKELIVTLNHEINSALTKIICHSDLFLMMSDQITPEELHTAATDIKVAAERIETVTKKLGSLKTVTTTEYLDDGTTMIDVNS
jgi:PAS domain-containing protein